MKSFIKDCLRIQPFASNGTFKIISIFNFYRLQCVKSILVVRSKTRLKHQCLIRTTNAVMSSTRPNACGVLNQRCLAVETMTLAARCGLHAAGFLVATRSMISPTSDRDMTSQTPSLLKQKKQTENEKDENQITPTMRHNTTYVWTTCAI